jgi:hypothetical protein
MVLISALQTLSPSTTCIVPRTLAVLPMILSALTADVALSLTNVPCDKSCHLLDNAGLNLQFRYDEDLKTEIPFFFGIPWLISDAVPTTGGSPDTTDIYVVPLEGETALRLLYAKDMNHDCDEWGIHCYDIPLQQSTSQLSKAVVAFYTLYVPEASLVRMNTVRLSNATALP